MSAGHEAISQDAEQLDYQDSMDARLYGDSLIRLDQESAVLAAEAKLSDWLGRDADDPDIQKVSTMVMAAQTAGVLTDHGGDKYAWQVVEAAGKLNPDESEHVGQLISTMGNAMSDPRTTKDELAVHATGMLGNYRAQRPELGDAADNFELVATAYVAGLCVGDKESATHMQDMLDRMIESRTVEQ